MASTNHDKTIQNALNKIVYRVSPPDGVWFDTDRNSDIKEILEKLVKNYSKNKFTP